MSLDHFSVEVPMSKLEGVVSFLLSCLQHMGLKEFMRPVPHVVGLGVTRPYLWIIGVDLEEGEEKAQERLLKLQHIAFTAENVDQVKQFHDAGLKAGGTCNGEPGPRPHYHPGYYGAFVRDPQCGLNFEVVCHDGAK